MTTHLAGAIRDIYQECGPDLGWGDRTPSKAEFRSVMRDLLCSKLSRQMLAEWDAMTKTAQNALLDRIL